MSDIISIFRDCSDKHGILTYNKPPDFSKAKDDNEKEGMIAKYNSGPQSIVKICKDHNIAQCFGIHFFASAKRWIDLGVNAVHISSASLGDRNPGVNASVQIQLGYTFWK